MGAPIIDAVGRWSAEEAAFEAGLPIGLMGILWWRTWVHLLAPSGGHVATFWELSLLLGACGAACGWAMARQMVVVGRRSLGPILLPGIALSLILMTTVTILAEGSWEKRCKSDFAGVPVRVQPIIEGEPPRLACRIGAVPSNPYLPGTLLEPMWSGPPSVSLWASLLLGSILAGLALRDRRIRPTRVPARLMERLWLAPTSGLKGVTGELGPDERVTACANPTLWGEPCAQLHATGATAPETVICPRCLQVFTPAGRTLRMTIVSLAEVDLEILNAWERRDATSWDRGRAMYHPARASGMERWTTLGEIELPDVISVAQALSVVLDRLPKLAAAGDERVKHAAATAIDRASRLAAWFWFGGVAHRLSYARPNHEVALGVGARRLRDVVRRPGEELWLQLDVGLLPLELRTAFHRDFVDGSRKAEQQNSLADLWIPTGPPGPAPGGPGLWVPRIEGDALRSWLSTARKPREGARGVSSPLPYLVEDKDTTASESESVSPGEAGETQPLGMPKSAAAVARPEPALPDPDFALDFAVLSLEDGGREVRPTRAPGDSIAQWEWFDWRQIEILRQRPLVLVEAEG